MVKWPFRRNQEQDVDLTPDEIQEQLPVEQQSSELPEQQELHELPSEVQEYYESERQQRSGVAWLLGFATLAITLLLAIALFFGGRWVYQKIANNNDDEKKITTSQSSSNENKNSNDANKQNQGTSSTNTNQNSGQSSANQPAPTPAPSSNSGSSSSNNSTATPQPATGKTTPNTGPGDVVEVFVITSIAGALFYQLVVHKREYNS